MSRDALSPYMRLSYWPFLLLTDDLSGPITQSIRLLATQNALS